VIIDEIQRRSDLFPILRLLADRDPPPARFLILGSASPDLLRRSSESLAGRIEFLEMAGFDMEETGVDGLPDLWWRGGFPRSFLAANDTDSVSWRENFIRTFLERDLPQLGLNIPALTLRRFWTMVAHYHGQTWNGSEIAGSLGINDTTARRHLDILAGAFMVRVLPPWFEKVAKRQRRAPKVYLRDSGILHSLLGITSPRALLTHPKCGASWEGLAIETVLRFLPTRDAYYWAVHGGPELDLLLFFEGTRLGFELKFVDAPELTRSMRVAMEDLSLDRILVIYPGDRRYILDDRIEAVPLKLIPEALARL
jgi:predicted AAA+ superfamily ATPase